MKIPWDEKNTSRIIGNICILTAGILIFLFFWNINVFIGGLRRILSLMTPFFVGFAIAYMLSTPMNFFERLYAKLLERKAPRKKLKRTFSVITIYLVALLAMVGLFTFILPQLISSVYILARNIPTYVQQLSRMAENFLLSQPQLNELFSDILSKVMMSSEEIMSAVLNMLNVALPKVLDFSMSFTSGLANFFLGVVISFYLLLSKEKLCAQLKKILFAIFPARYVEGAIQLARHSHQIFNGFITGKILDGFIVGTICFVCMTIFGWPYPLLIAVIMGVFSLIPFFGAIIGAVISTLLILIINPIQALWFVIFIVVLQQIDGNIIDPRISGGATGLPAIWALFAILTLGGEFGFLGMVLAIPVFAVGYAIVRGITEHKLFAKGLNWRTSAYESPSIPIKLGKKKKKRVREHVVSFHGRQVAKAPYEEEVPPTPRQSPFPPPWKPYPQEQAAKKEHNE